MTSFTLLSAYWGSLGTLHRAIYGLAREKASNEAGKQPRLVPLRLQWELCGSKEGRGISTVFELCITFNHKGKMSIKLY